MSHCGKSINTLDIVFLHCYTASTLMHVKNSWSFECRIAKISFIQSVLYHSASSTVTELSLYLSTSRWRVHDVYHWNPTSGDNIQAQIRRPDNVAVELWAAGGRCQYSRTPLLASTVAADTIINLFVLDQACLIAATNGCFQVQARPQPGPQVTGWPAGRWQEQSICTHNMNIIDFQ